MRRKIMAICIFLAMVFSLIPLLWDRLQNGAKGELPASETIKYQPAILESFAVKSSMIFAMAFNPAGDRLAIGLQEGVVLLYDVNTRKRLALLGGGRTGDRIECLHFSRDGKRLAAGTVRGYVYLWTVDGSLLYESEVFSGLFFSSPIIHLAFGNNDLLNLYSFREMASVEVSKGAVKKKALPVYAEYGASFMGNSMLADHEGHAYMFSEDGTLKDKIKLSTGPVTFFTQFKNTCLIGSWVGELVVFDPKQAKATIPWPGIGEGRQITDCAVLDKDRLAMVFDCKSLQIYETTDGMKKLGFEIVLPKCYRSMAYRPNSNHLYLGLYERCILIHNVDGGHLFPFLETE